ncbi:cysteine synthase family protein [Oligoflexia bacterium]|nr:cysteine synthase family protein [Oligoflexia bacterium]
MVEIGNTPLIAVSGVYAKLECINPCGSVKDRIAKYIIDESEKQGLLKPGMTIVEATSGNTGIAFSYYGSIKGYSVTIVMPENMTEERKTIIRDLGAKLILSSEEGSFAGAAAVRDEMAQDPTYFNPDQFSNLLNVECHYKTTAQEILEQIGEHSDRIDAFVAGIGTGGTLIGIGRALREHNPKVHLVAVEPSESAVMSGGEPGAHDIAGIGDGFIPAIAGDGQGGLNPLIDEVLCISSEEAKQAARYISETHGFCVGFSSGANWAAAKKLAEKYKTVVTVFADGYYKYQSKGLTHCEKNQCPYETDRVGTVAEEVLGSEK